jgi:tubulin--tyrosine ligase
MQVLDKFPEKVTNHLQYSRLIGNKKALYKTMSIYYQLSKKSSRFLPMTYHVQNGLEDPEYIKFLSEYFRRLK